MTWLFFILLLAIKLVVVLLYYPTGWLLPVSGLPGYPISDNWLPDFIKAIPFVVVVFLWWPRSMTLEALRLLGQGRRARSGVQTASEPITPPCVICGLPGELMAISTRGVYCQAHATSDATVRSRVLYVGTSLPRLPSVHCQTYETSTTDFIQSPRYLALTASRQ